jgi:hypothetical protein
MIDLITLALAVAVAFAIGYVCGRRSDEEREADAERIEAMGLLLATRAAHIAQLHDWNRRLRVEAELAEQQRQAAFRAVEGP